MKESIENLESSETIFEKGIGLEKEFCEYLKTNLGWEKARIRSQMASKFNMRGTNVDIITQRLDDRGRRLKLVSNFYFILSAIAFLLGIYLTIDDDSIGMIIMLVGVFIFLGALFSLNLSEKLNKENAWVECKNLKTKVNISQVQKTIDEYKHYKESGNNEYKFVECYFVSTNGFIENALKLAIDNHIICYTKENGIFKKIEYWD